jgi:lipopolysaccharide kinase (Kdo/WaaP) family protein
MKEYWNDQWQEIFSANKLDSFDAIWNLDTEWFEEPNQRRGGWSGVIKVDLDLPEGKISVFIKRQENHITKTLFHPLRGIPTFEREFKNILRMQKHNLPIMELVFFAKRVINGNLQAILITKALSDYIPLESERFLSSGDLIKNTAHKENLLSAVADTLRQIHHHHFQHNCLYLKHIFVKPVNDDSWDIKIIDLEKLKWRLFKPHAVFRDLYTLYRHAKGWSTKDHVKLFKAYVQEPKLSSKSKKLWHSIEARVLDKRR